MDSKEGSCDCALVLCNTHFAHSIYLYINFILSNYHNSVIFHVVFVIVYWFYAVYFPYSIYSKQGHFTDMPQLFSFVHVFW